MHRSLIALALVAGCGGSDQGGNNVAQPVARTGQSGANRAAVSAEREADGRETLAGLYEGGRADRPNQLCVMQKAGKTQFGVVVWGANLNSCSGAGEAVRSGDTVSLKMTGDSPCTIEAALDGGAVTFRRALGAGCTTYYCGNGARFEGAAFTRKGATAADAKKATDIAGDPLCG